MAPGRPEDPIAALGAYWARPYRALPAQIRGLEAPRARQPWHFSAFDNKTARYCDAHISSLQHARPVTPNRY